MKNYPQEYIDGCRARVDSDVAAFRRVVAEARDKGADAEALERLETTFFNNMVLLLDYLFVHRLRTIEGKGGNPLHEVRALCSALLPPGGGPAVKLSPTKSVLELSDGDEVKLTDADFALLSEAFFGEIERKYA